MNEELERALRNKIARQQKQIDLLEKMIEDGSRDIFHANEELRLANDRLRTSMTEQEQMHRALVDASRKAGMADVATSVLHNVGNVLNSVNVSADVVAKSMRTSKGHGLAKALELVRSQADPVRFFAEDPRGKKVLAYLDGVANELAAERTSVLEELTALSRNIEHIKTIVSQQQSLARASGTTELVEIAQLLEDAIHINEASFGRHEVEIERDFANAGTLAVDRHKLMQIIMNLVTNASQAVKAKPGKRKVTLRAVMDADRVAIQVIDNGVGIAPEHLAKIFNYGFTTKATGHGFGLHSSACAAGELGGSLSVKSAGPGEGATFTIVVPREPRVRSLAPSSLRPRTQCIKSIAVE